MNHTKHERTLMHTSIPVDETRIMLSMCCEVMLYAFINQSKFLLLTAQGAIRSNISWAPSARWFADKSRNICRRRTAKRKCAQPAKKKGLEEELIALVVEMDRRLLAVLVTMPCPTRSAGTPPNMVLLRLLGPLHSLVKGRPTFAS